MQQQVGGDQYFVRQSNIIPTIMYTYVISNHELSQMPAHLVMMLVLYFFVLLLVGGLLVYILTRRSFRPYAKIIDEVQQIDSNVRPQNAEVLLEKIHDLVESNHQYASMQNDVTHDLKLLFLKNLLLNSYSQKDISRFADLLALDELQNGGVIGILTFSQIALSEEPLGINERKDARKKNIVALWPKPLNLLFDIDVNHYAILSEHGPNTTDDFVHTLNHTAVQLSKRLKIPVHALISIPFHNLNEIPVRFADVYSTATATPEDVTTKPTAIMLSNGVYTVETEAAILASVSQRDFAKADQLLDQALTKTLTANRTTLAALTNIKFVFLNTLKRTLDSVGLSVTDFIDENRKVVNQLDLETSPKQVKASIITLFHDAFDRISKLSKHHRTLEEHIIDYIARRYTSDLALSEIADHYHLSESHTSRLIKEHLGISFKDYLIQLRMRQAKSLLNNTDQKVADIAEAVGYKNVNTFIRIFKATTGQTPGKFRRSTDID
ncbi:helix-turn-helix transcriptional regulator [Lacticaseibacillus manihotivorans]|nr:helix-turn-helix transcriptional regulator [Lacticaseibacillus manihotivorans]